MYAASISTRRFAVLAFAALLSDSRVSGQSPLLKPSTQVVSTAPILSKLPTPGRVVGKRTVDGLGVTEWTLSNGARVLVKPTSFKSGEILFSGSSDGGLSLASDADYLNASRAIQILGLSGAGQFNRIELNKRLSGRSVAAGPSIGPYAESVAGTTTPRDLETMLQLVYLRLTEPRIDTAAWRTAKQREQATLAAASANAGQVFSDTVLATMTQHTPRARPLTPAMLESIDPTRAIAFYKDRFSDVGDFTFAFVGDLTLDGLKPLVEKYLASLPGHGRKETWKDVNNPSPRGMIDKVVRMGTAPKAMTRYYFTGPFRYTAENRFALSALIAIVQARLNTTLRPQLGGSYRVAATGGSSRVPREEYSITVTYESKPENVATLTRALLAMIDTLQSIGPSQSEVVRVRNDLARARASSLKQNGFWISNISSREESVDSLPSALKQYDMRVQRLSVGQIQAAAKLYFNTSNYARFVLTPESFKQ